MAKILIIFSALLALAAALDPGYEQKLMQDIVNSVSRAKHLNPNTLFEKICFTNLGCFESNGPMRQTGATPLSPDQIGTKFLAYNAGVKEPTLLDPSRPETFAAVNPSKKLTFVIHGFGMDGTSQELNDIKDSLLGYTGDEVGTVVLVDWKKGAASPDYLSAASNTQVVGRQVAHLVQQLTVHRSIAPSAVHLIGFSLGAQVSGYAGKFTRTEYNFKLGRITGLDAAAPLFEGYPGSHLTSEDADFVDGIHSSAGGNILMGEVGFVEPYAHLDFYPNGGRKQPHCGLFSGVTCNHYGSVLFFDASMHANEKCQFHGVACTNWDQFVAKKCGNDADVELGYWAHASRKRSPAPVGSRFLATTKKNPFCH